MVLPGQARVCCPTGFLASVLCLVAVAGVTGAENGEASHKGSIDSLSSMLYDQWLGQVQRGIPQVLLRLYALGESDATTWGNPQPVSEVTRPSSEPAQEPIWQRYQHLFRPLSLKSNSPSNGLDE